VRVARDDSGEPGSGRIEVEFRKVVKNVDRVGADFDNIAGRKLGSPSPPIIVAADRADRCKGSECVQDGWVADVAAMNDEVRLPERVECLGTNQTVGI
jgi:hypothetical protein